MSETTLQLILLVLGGVITVIATVLASFVWYLIKTVLTTNTNLAVLSSKIESIISDTKSIPKMQQDLNILHAWKKSQHHQRSSDET